VKVRRILQERRRIIDNSAVYLSIVKSPSTCKPFLSQALPLASSSSRKLVLSQTLVLSISNMNHPPPPPHPPGVVLPLSPRQRPDPSWQIQPEGFPYPPTNPFEREHIRSYYTEQWYLYLTTDDIKKFELSTSPAPGAFFEYEGLLML
jgi:hypothetical protein